VCVCVCVCARVLCVVCCVFRKRDIINIIDDIFRIRFDSDALAGRFVCYITDGERTREREREGERENERERKRFVLKFCRQEAQKLTTTKWFSLLKICAFQRARSPVNVF